jgi:ribosomal subunit interface protein
MCGPDHLTVRRRLRFARRHQNTTQEVNAMFIDIRALDFDLTDAIRRHVESRVESALGAVTRQVLTVTARLEDVNAGRGGIDKRCRLVAALRRDGLIVAEATHADLYAAVDEAADRLRRSALRFVERKVTRSRKLPRRARPALVGT